VVPDQTFSDYKSVTLSPVFLRGYVTQVVPNLNARPAMHLDMLSPPGLSGAPIIREDGRDVLDVLVGDRNIQLGGESFRFGEALLLDALRSARSTATDHRPLGRHAAPNRVRSRDMTLLKLMPSCKRGRRCPGPEQLNQSLDLARRQPIFGGPRLRPTSAPRPCCAQLRSARRFPAPQRAVVAAPGGSSNEY
jgi:hypothetical protein